MTSSYPALLGDVTTLLLTQADACLNPTRDLALASAPSPLGEGTSPSGLLPFTQPSDR